ncbi:hypothetical protein COLO4_00780, partial [Corchorus olitorius]
TALGRVRCGFCLHGGALAVHEVAQRINAAQTQDGIAHGGFDQHSQVAAGGHLDLHHVDRQPQHIEVLRIERQAFELAIVAAHELHDQLDLHLPAHRGFTEDRLDVEQAQAAHFQQVLQQRRAAPLNEVRTQPHEVDCVVGNEAVAARDQFQAQLALAQTRIAHDQHAHAKDVEKHPVHRHARCRDARQIQAQVIDDGSRGNRRREQRRRRTRAAQLQVRGRIHTIGHDQEGRLQQDQLAHLSLAVFFRQALVVGDLGLAEHLDAIWMDEVQVPDEVRRGGRFLGEVHVERAVRALQAGDPRQLQIGCVVVKDRLGDDAGQFHSRARWCRRGIARSQSVALAPDCAAIRAASRSVAGESPRATAGWRGLRACHGRTAAGRFQTGFPNAAGWPVQAPAGRSVARPVCRRVIQRAPVRTGA